MTDLKPCPFCGNAEIYKIGMWNICTKCKAQAPKKFWNKRSEK